MSTDFPLSSPVQGTNGGVFDAFVAKITGTPLPVITLAITPDVTSVPRGGSLGYTVTATNTTATVQCFNYWENVTLPDLSTFPAVGSLLFPIPFLCLNAGGSKTVHLSHGVPTFAPVGAYVFNAFVGAFAFPILPVPVDAAHFNFNVTAFGPLTNHPATSWRLLENGFRK